MYWTINLKFGGKLPLNFWKPFDSVKQAEMQSLGKALELFKIPFTVLLQAVH